MESLIHLYHGEGKGKSTASFGLALRAIASGKKVVVCQFLKNGKSGEVLALENKFGVIIYTAKNIEKFSWQMDENERKLSYNLHNEIFEKAINEQCDLLILDEICAVCTTELIDIEKVENFLENRPKNTEIVLTGRNPQQFMLEKADYITEMKKIKHPFDEGISARKGIEF